MTRSSPSRRVFTRARHGLPNLGGVVSVTPIRDRSGEQGETFSVSWHSPLGDLRWLSPRISSQESADVAAQVLSDFTGAVKR
jgi:hypothetical protein